MKRNLAQRILYNVGTQTAGKVVALILSLLSILYVGLILIADIINAWLDPRIRVG